MTAPTCQAAEFLRARGPAQVPLRACCAAAVIRSAVPGTPFLCGGLTAPPDARLAEEPAVAAAEPVP